MQKKNIKQTVKKAFADSLPICAGYIVLGFGFGILLKAKGYGILWSAAMSIFIYAGSMQYLAVDLMAGGASLVAAALTALMVNARHLFYGISMVNRYKDTGGLKPYLIFSLTDETYSLVCSADEHDGGVYYFIVSLLNQIYWVTGSLLGSLAGAYIPFGTEGIDFALTALFVTVFTEQWRTGGGRFSAVCGVAVSVVCLAVFGADSFLIPSMIGITVVLTLFRNRLSGRGDMDE